MQVSATLIAAQQAAREAQARFQAVHVQPPQTSASTSFAAALGAPDEFSPLPLRQTAKAEAPAPAAPQAPAGRMGTLLDIKI
jgi:hypothetical protein